MARLNHASRGEVDWPGEDGTATGDMLVWDATLGRYVATPSSGLFISRCSKTANQSFLTTALANVDDTTMGINAGATAHFEYWIPFVSIVSTTGLVLSVDGPGATIDVAFGANIATSDTTSIYAVASAYNQKLVGTGSAGVNQPIMARVYGTIINGTASGNVILRAASEVESSSATIKALAYGIVTQ